MVITIHDFTRRGDIELIRREFGFEVYYKAPDWDRYRFVGYILYTPAGVVFEKVVDVCVHRGLGQYYVYYKTAGTSIHVIDYIEKHFKPISYAIKFCCHCRPLGYIIWTPWHVFLEKAKLKKEGGYEAQYQVDLPEDIEDLIEQAKKSGKIFRIIISEEGVTREWLDIGCRLGKSTG